MNSTHNIMISAAIIGILSLFVFILFGDNGLAELDMMKKSRDSLIKKNEVIIHKNMALYRDIERLRTDLDYIENVARQELGVIGKNEMIFKFIKTDQKN
ncbi:septum formation initiator family protein [Desulfobacterales bacterium HSG17]|nr:septum formation initiator family protein [Desulfobacterales bacterium HSG17]